VTSHQLMRQAARRSALDAQAVLRKERADREARNVPTGNAGSKVLRSPVLTALGERAGGRDQSCLLRQLNLWGRELLMLGARVHGRALLRDHPATQDLRFSPGLGAVVRALRVSLWWLGAAQRRGCGLPCRGDVVGVSLFDVSFAGVGEH